METLFAAGAILSPIGLAIFIAIPAAAIFIARRPGLPAWRLTCGYLGALLVLSLLIGASSYVSPEDAVTVWHVPPERYWDALLKSFLATFVVGAFALEFQLWDFRFL